MDLSTDELVRVAHAYTHRVGQLEAELHEQGVNVPSAWLNEMSVIRLQLAVVMRRLRGLLRAVRQLDFPDLHDAFGYLRDVSDHLEEAVDDVSILLEKSGAIITMYEHILE